MINKIKLICNDLDGVLVPAVYWHYLSFNKALKEVAGFEIGEEEHELTFNGLPTKKKLEILLSSDRIHQSQMESIFDLKQKYTNDVILENATLDYEKIDMHKYLKSMGYKLACVTNSIYHSAHLMLQKTGQLEYLDLLITNEQVQNPKPHGEGYIRAMIHFHSFPEETLIVEDSPKGLEAAKSTGAKVWQVKDSSEVTLENIKKVLCL